METVKICLLEGGEILAETRKREIENPPDTYRDHSSGWFFKRLFVATFNGWIKYQAVGKLCFECHGRGSSECSRCGNDVECEMCGGKGYETEEELKSRGVL
jgi:hypothetical protein